VVAGQAPVALERLNFREGGPGPVDQQRPGLLQRLGPQDVAGGRRVRRLGGWCLQRLGVQTLVSGAARELVHRKGQARAANPTQGVTRRVAAVAMTLNGHDVTFSQHRGVALPVGEDRYLPGSPQGADAGRVADALANASWRHGLEPFSFRVTYCGIADAQPQQLQLDIGTGVDGEPNRVRRVTHAILASSTQAHETAAEAAISAR